MGSRVSSGADDDAVAYEVDMTPEALRAAVEEAGGTLIVATRQGTQFAVTEHTVIEPLDE